MAAANTYPMTYASRITSGSAALDLDRVPVYERPETTVARPERQTGTKVKTVVRTAENTQGVSLFAIVGMAAAAVMLVFVLLAYVRLAEVAAETTALQSQITTLQAEETKLRVAYEQAFNLSEIESYATKTLGMVYPTESQIIHLNGGLRDKAVILEENASDPGEVGGFYRFLRSLAEYFK